MLLKRIIIIGAGAAGVYASIQLKKQCGPEFEVIVLEQNATSLKKLLATGNGRCNLSNKKMDISYYQSDQQNYVQNIIDDFDMDQAMKDLGLYCFYQGDLLYPKSEQALSVKTILMNQAKQEGVVFLYDQEVFEIKASTPYQIKTSQQTFKADIVIFAMGSEAGKLSGTSLSRYHMLEHLKLNVIPSTPSLVQLTTQPVLKSLKGVRVKGTFQLLENNQCLHKEKGELLFTDYGVSGIAVMQISSFYNPTHHQDISIDFFDEMSVEELEQWIQTRLDQFDEHPLDGLFNTKIAHYFENLHIQDAHQMALLLKDYRLKITGTRNYETAQVMKGGLSLGEVNQDLELLKYPHMYAIGEILNVTGLCGGYNLHFAFASAKHVAKTIEREYYAKNS